jgi:chemotaxis protein methyltransferase WspC
VTVLIHLERLLKQTMGLDVASIGMTALERAVQTRQRACGTTDTAAYLERVRTTAGELQALIEAIVIPETWFFRDREAFAVLVRFVQEEWLPAHAEGCLRLLSLPCSTGEEPYSMAMALLDARIPGNRFRIDAVDICGRSLDQARRGIYRKGSFRGKDTAFRERYFQDIGAGHALSDAVRQQVQFQQGNLLQAGFLPAANVYDAVFCRNMLIYFDSETQDRAVSVLERLLAPSGMLFAGSSESALFLNHAFSSVKVPMAFAFRKGRAVSKLTMPAAATKIQRPAPRLPAANAGAVARAPLPMTRPQEPTEEQVPPGPEEAMKLADQGHFAEASRCCEEYLRRHGPSADAYHVLGLVRDALGNGDDATTYYRKALYLDPGHQEALAHLALLMERHGQKSEAEALWNRARRLATPKAQ